MMCCTDRLRRENGLVSAPLDLIQIPSSRQLFFLSACLLLLAPKIEFTVLSSAFVFLFWEIRKIPVFRRRRMENHALCI